MGRLERHLDVDLIAKIERGWKPSDTIIPLKRVKPPRSAGSYRGARRNALRKLREISPGYFVEKTNAANR